MKNNRRCPVVGITGGIACGKSEAAQVFAQEGFSVCDTDVLARDVLEPNGACIQKIVDRFGSDVLDDRGGLDRKKMADRVFGSDVDRKALNAIMHPPIMKKVALWLGEQKEIGSPAAVVVPLLYEIGVTNLWDAVVCIAAREDVMMARMKMRGLTENEAQGRLRAQWPVEEKVRRANYVIWNNGTLEEFKNEIRKICRKILE